MQKLKPVYQGLVKATFPETHWKTGEVGIEVEVEGRNLPASLQYHWGTHADGSLRIKDPGDQAIEYVLREPVERAAVNKVLNYLDSRLRLSDAKVYPSNRTSVHVHLNFQQHTWTQAFNMLTLWYILEDPLVAWCGDDRVCNLFCLRARDAEYVIDNIVKGIGEGDPHGYFNDNIRYSAMNLCALMKYGSLEVRCLSGTVEPAKINYWVETLLTIKDKALAFPHPRAIIETFSGNGPYSFAESILGVSRCHELGFGDHWDEPYDAMRRAQEIGYASNWEAAPVEQKKTRVKGGRYGSGLTLEQINTLGLGASITYAEATPMPQASFEPQPDGWGALQQTAPMPATAPPPPYTTPPAYRIHGNLPPQGTRPWRRYNSLEAAITLGKILGDTLNHHGNRYVWAFEAASTDPSWCSMTHLSPGVHY